MVREIKLYNPGVLIKDIPDDLFAEIKKDIEHQISQKPYILGVQRANMKLASQIDKTYEFTIKKSLINFLKEYHREYCEYFSYPFKDGDYTESWINVQEKHEFNPIHIHSGDLAWVAYIRIPYDLEKEDSLPNAKRSLQKVNSRFVFTYSTFSGGILNRHLDIDSDYEGKMMMFPHDLNHSVYPFYTSDDYRISLAGNIKPKSGQ